jgi:hypothetical protein
MELLEILKKNLNNHDRIIKVLIHKIKYHQGDKLKKLKMILRFKKTKINNRGLIICLVNKKMS